MSPSASRDWRLYADDIVEACGRIRRYIAGMNYEMFAADERTRDAVIRNLEIIGEASKNLPAEVTAREQHIPWRLICGMRDVLAHGYFGLSLQVVWDTASVQVAELENAVRRLLA